MIIINDYSPFYYSFVALSVTPENKRETSETQQLGSIAFSQVAHSFS